MLILPGLLQGLLSFIAIGLDVCMFFLLVRLFLIWRKISWFERFNDIGKNLVVNSGLKVFSRCRFRNLKQ